MTYFNPAIYNKENLKAEDKAYLEACESILRKVISSTQDDFVDASEIGGNSRTMKSIVQEIVDAFCTELKINLGYELQDHVVGIIDSYEDDSVPERENYTTFMYNAEEDEENE